MVLCYLAVAEVGALVVLRMLGVPDVVTFTLFGMIIVTLAYWLDKTLSTKGLYCFGRKIIGKRDGKYQKIILVGLCLVITLAAYWMSGLM